MQLKKFTTFANLLYPHELNYIHSIEQFENLETLAILKIIDYNVKNPDQTTPFPKIYDKRRYSNLMKWIRDKLEQADVDVFFEWIIEMEKRINMDLILAADEKKLLKLTQTITPDCFYFIRFYEMLSSYRDYLLIRTRVDYYQSVQKYLETFDAAHRNAIEINRKMNQSAIDIIHHHTTTKGDSIQWESFMLKTFQNQKIDGFTRYKAFVRITYIYYNYRQFDKLQILFNELDKEIQTVKFYSKRILANYYANRAMMHSMLREMDLAEKYAYLSIRQHNSDFLFYLIKLCNILIIKNKNNDALVLMQQHLPDLKTTNSMYTKIGFVSVYLRVLNKCGKYALAESHGDTFLSAHKKEIFTVRWHIFFCPYFMSLLRQEKYKKVIHLEKKYNLSVMEKDYLEKARYVPTLLWYQALAKYMENRMSLQHLKELVIQSSLEIPKNKYITMKIRELHEELSDFLPNLFTKSELTALEKQLTSVSDRLPNVSAHPLAWLIRNLPKYKDPDNGVHKNSRLKTPQ